LLVEKDCTDPATGEIIAEVLEKKLSKNEIDIEYLTQTLKSDSEYILEDDDLFVGD
jgi:hypothetical protein